MINIVIMFIKQTTAETEKSKIKSVKKKQKKQRRKAVIIYCLIYANKLFITVLM